MNGFDPYAGTPLWLQPLYWVALIMIVASLATLFGLVWGASRAQEDDEDERPDPLSPASREIAVRDVQVDERERDYLWVFVVPALNEERTIADSVARLAAVAAAHRIILVINDGSDDDTGRILDGLDVPGLIVLTRTAPNARKGKAQALNDAWHYLHTRVLDSPDYRGWDPDHVIVTIVDADGRLAPNATDVVKHFVDERVGGVQSLVRIYNRSSFLTWAQNLEFLVFGKVFQRGRSRWGTANMGGNGQFNRLSALDSVVVPVPQHAARRAASSEEIAGPWRARLTEDQDIGVRMLQAGWRGEQSTTVTIDQQGLNSFRTLYRQRTRWSQGTWQSVALVRGVGKLHANVVAKFDHVWYLLTPLVQAVVGLSVLASIVQLLLGDVSIYMPWQVVVAFYVLSFAPGVVVIFASLGHTGLKSVIVAVVLAHLYLIYTWMIYPVVFRALGRQVARRTGWAKTAREKIDEPAQAPGQIGASTAGELGAAGDFGAAPAGETGAQGVLEPAPAGGQDAPIPGKQIGPAGSPGVAAGGTFAWAGRGNGLGTADAAAILAVPMSRKVRAPRP
ncbi:glycosyltransferase family 2 protein [Rarobacter incanus]|uniref:Cellulose synthase/poly-beta-1,6-N-acetylglucosamine synthase-like glycosyltransferase n=1 Tax=Rarobacter incanus TaxID=153494 RepID=A0A542SM75_9MICO|nr:glycosyltransferase [Rarobacter incanus]TQK75731.1 cellulose synthase/poly-beta-1,6-N-acetylglucosamine synthase-like glycosyltransferase [Rarobacter incanus]